MTKSRAILVAELAAAEIAEAAADAARKEAFATWAAAQTAVVTARAALDANDAAELAAAKESAR